MIVCCHGNSLRHTHINEKEIPGVWLIFTVNARSLNPKVKQIVHFQFFILFLFYIFLFYFFFILHVARMSLQKPRSKFPHALIQITQQKLYNFYIQVASSLYLIVSACTKRAQTRTKKNALGHLKPIGILEVTGSYSDGVLRVKVLSVRTGAVVFMIKQLKNRKST